MFCKIAFLALFVALAHAKDIQIKNGGKATLTVSVSGQADRTILPGQVALVSLADGWSGTISGCAEGACSVGLRTKVVLNLSSTDGDSHCVSLIDGHNLPAKVIPIQGTDCNSSVCAARVTKCPVANQVTDSSNKVVACSNCPWLKTVCPRAVVSEADKMNIEKCFDALSYLIMLG